MHAANTPEIGPVRYRCNACGNLTRFDVIVASRTKSFHHYSIGGELTVESVDVLDQRVEEAACRWCGHGKAVVTVTGAVPESPGPSDGSPPPNPTD